MVKRVISCLVVGLLTFGLVHFISTRTKLFSGMERALLDGLYYMREPAFDEVNPFVADRVLLLGYDEDSIAVIGKWPWKRYVHAKFLNNIERFSPEAVMFDVIFAKSESIPDFIEEKLNLDPKARQQVEEAFAEMDNEFARALADHDNVYLDLQLIEEPRPDLPEYYLNRILNNERVMQNYSLPAELVRSPNVFHSLEPILDDYVHNAHPVVINVLGDEDGVVRFFPLYYTYKMSDGATRNMFTVALTMLTRFYRVDREDVSIEPGKVVLRAAKVPIRYEDTHQPRLFTRDFEDLSRRITNPDPPERYRYNTNLYQLVSNRLHLGYGGDERIPSYPIHVLELDDGKLEILDGWEIFDGAARAGSDRIDVITYRMRDLTIPTPLGSFYYINYSGKEAQVYNDPDSGEPRIYRPIPTGSYRDVYSLPPLPDIPDLEAPGDIFEGYDTRLFESWFMKYCEEKTYEIYARAKSALGEAAEDDSRIARYMNDNPYLGKYFFYYYFFANTGAEPGTLRSLIESYPEFGRDMGQDPAYFFDETQMVSALMEFYGEQFDRYYNKFIFTGANATGLGDIQQTPYASMFGVNVIMNAFNTVATENILTMSVDVPHLNVLLLLGASLLFCLLYGLSNIRISSVIFVVLLLSTFVIGLILFKIDNFVLKTTPLVFSNVIIFVGMVMYKLLTEEKDKKFLKATFQNYLSPELIEDMHNSKARPKLGGEAKIITAYFTDIQGFSTFSEKLTAEQLVELLNEYLTAMTDILTHDKGTLDKYEGDAIIAFFGAPMELPDHSLRACRVAVKMQSTLLSLREKWRQEKQGPHDTERNVQGFPPDQWAPGDKWPGIVHEMKMRIGVNTGEIVVGNMGSTMRMNYTMMGDAVNLAARLEAGAKQYGVYTLVSEYTLNTEYEENGVRMRIMDMVEARFIDTITVVGRSEPVRVYELCAMKGELTDSEKKLFGLFDEGIRRYLNMDWDGAIAAFNESRHIERVPDGTTTPSLVYLDRCHAFKENPPVAPGEAWDGVYRLTKK